MPYIEQKDRAKLDMTLKHLCGKIDNVGELNYCFTTILLDYMNRKGIKYENWNAVMGVLDCVAKEMYRRWAAPYEDIKRGLNGDIKQGPFGVDGNGTDSRDN